MVSGAVNQWKILIINLGSPGFGKDDDDYVEEDMTYCMGGPGIIMSRELLRRLSPHLPSCLKKLMTEHEDLELGRCIQEKLGISCIRAYEANRLFKQNYDYNKQSAKERYVERFACMDLGDNKSVFESNTPI